MAKSFAIFVPTRTFVVSVCICMCVCVCLWVCVYTYIYVWMYECVHLVTFAPSTTPTSSTWVPTTCTFTCTSPSSSRAFCLLWDFLFRFLSTWFFYDTYVVVDPRVFSCAVVSLRETHRFVLESSLLIYTTRRHQFATQCPPLINGSAPQSNSRLESLPSAPCLPALTHMRIHISQVMGNNNFHIIYLSMLHYAYTLSFSLILDLFFKLIDLLHILHLCVNFESYISTLHSLSLLSTSMFCNIHITLYVYM